MSAKPSANANIHTDGSPLNVKHMGTQPRRRAHRLVAVHRDRGAPRLPRDPLRPVRRGRARDPRRRAGPARGHGRRARRAACRAPARARNLRRLRQRDPRGAGAGGGRDGRGQLMDLSPAAWQRREAFEWLRYQQHLAQRAYRRAHYRKRRRRLLITAVVVVAVAAVSIVRCRAEEVGESRAPSPATTCAPVATSAVERAGDTAAPPTPTPNCEAATGGAEATEDARGVARPRRAQLRRRSDRLHRGGAGGPRPRGSVALPAGLWRGQLRADRGRRGARPLFRPVGREVVLGARMASMYRKARAGEFELAGWEE